VNEPIEQTRGIDTLVPHPRNYNQHPPAQIERLAASLRQFGQVRPIVVHGDTIVAGHGVYLAAQHLGYTSLRVTQLPDDWTDEQAMAYLVADNETRRGAEPSDTELAALLDELQQQDFDLDSLGFDEVEYGALLDGLTPDLPAPSDGGDEFEPDDAAPCRVQTGDVWLIGGVHRLICGDSTEPATVGRLMQGERADAVVTDPPYGMNLDTEYSSILLSEKARTKHPVQRDYAPVIGDNKPYDPTTLMVLFADIPEQYWFGADYYRKYLPDGGSWLVWDKRVGVEDVAFHTASFELCWSKTPHRREIIRARWMGLIGMETQDTEHRVHPTQKPLEVYLWLFEHRTKHQALIFDGYLGSGTTIIAAHRTGRRCYGCEISEAYCEVIL
jgi:DNA modification methylase